MNPSLPKIALILSLCIWLLPFAPFAQQTNFEFRLYDFDDGLTHRNVFKVQQDTNGFIWLATINGLNKFDGHQFTHYTSEIGNFRIPNNYLTDMLIDKKNQLWLGSGAELIKVDWSEVKYFQWLPK